MALTFTTTQTGTANYAKFLGSNPVKHDKRNQPDLLDFSLVPYSDSSATSGFGLEDGSGRFLNEAGGLLVPEVGGGTNSISTFVKLTRGTRIILSSLTYNNWFTGYITNDPSLTQLGTRNNIPIYGYQYEASDDSYLLNLKPVGLLPPFINTTSGAIIKQIIALLDTEAQFDVSRIQTGIPVSRYIVDPNKKLTEILQDFTEPMGYRWRCNNFTFSYSPQDFTPAAITVDGNSKHFNSNSLLITPATDPFVNDSIIVGGIEPQDYVNEYFLGDGSTNAFPLMSSAYGITSAVLIDETFQSSEINSQFWNTYDTPSNFLQVSNGYLNVLGGSNNGSYDVSLQSASVIALERQMRLTHGQIDFLPDASVGTNGVIGGLWTQAPNFNFNPSASLLMEDGNHFLNETNGLFLQESSAASLAFSGCVYGIRVTKSGTTTTLNPIINGQPDISQSVIIDYSKRYVIRTLIGFQNSSRRPSVFTSRTKDGRIISHIAPIVSDSANIQTYFVAIDPITGAVAGTAMWSNRNTVVNGNDSFALYIPVASNDLHLTITGITISYPLMASLDIAPSVTGTPVQQLFGPNDIDSLDGLAPVATIAQATTTSSRNNNLGSVQYDAGNPTLTFFKDSLKQTSTTPPAKSLLHVSYRRAGTAVGRVQDPVSVANEALAWGDSGLRSQQRSDLKPLPLTSIECELAAAAQVAEYGYQHYSGTYTQVSAYEFTGEPRSGTILKFQNLGSSYPADFQSALIDEITTEMIGDRKDLFSHVISFGQVNQADQVLAELAGKEDVLGTLDPTDALSFIPINSVGTVFAPDVTAPSFISVDPSSYNYDTNQQPPVYGTSGYAGGFEVRSTNDNWGADDARNLIGRFNSPSFNIPRTSRGRVCFVKAYDIRNIILWSEDFTQSAWVVGAGVNSVARSTGNNPSFSLGYINRIQFSSATNGYVQQTSGVWSAGQQAVFSVSVKGPAGQTARIQLGNVSGTVLGFTEVTLTGRWQRISVSGTFSSFATGNITVAIIYTGVIGDVSIFDSNAYDVANGFQPSVTGTGFITQATTSLYVTRASLEVGALTESNYFKTNSRVYGATSRYAAALRCNFPLVPQPVPVASIGLTDPSKPVVSVTLPDILQDVWGVEIRAADNITVLYKGDLISSGFNPVISFSGLNVINIPDVVLSGNISRNLSYYIYTYNLLGEYSNQYNVTATVHTPSISNLKVDDSGSGLLTWFSPYATGYIVTIGLNAGFTSTLLTKTVDNQYMALDDVNILSHRWFSVTPFDQIGQGTEVRIEHFHVPAGVSEWIADSELYSVPKQPTPTTDIAVPPKFSQYTTSLQEQARSLRSDLTRRESY